MTKIEVTGRVYGTGLIDLFKSGHIKEITFAGDKLIITSDCIDAVKLTIKRDHGNSRKPLPKIKTSKYNRYETFNY